MLNPNNRPMLTIIVVEALLAIGASVVAFYALQDNLTLLILTGLAAITALFTSKFNLWTFGAAAVFGGAVQALFDQTPVRFWALIALFFIGWAFDQFGNWAYDRKNEVKQIEPIASRNISFALLPIGISLALVYVLMREDFATVLDMGYERWTELLLFYAKGVMLSPYLWIGLAAAGREINFDIRQFKRFFRQLGRSLGAVGITIVLFLPFALISPFIFGVLFEMFSKTISISTELNSFATMQFVIYLPAIVSVLAAGWGARWKDQVPVSSIIEKADEILEGELIEDEDDNPDAEQTEEDKEPATLPAQIPAEAESEPDGTATDPADTLNLKNEDSADTPKEDI